jgi:hypothetical protein
MSQETTNTQEQNKDSVESAICTPADVLSQDSDERFKNWLDTYYPNKTNEEKEIALKELNYYKKIVAPAFIRKAKLPINQHLFQ